MPLPKSVTKINKDGVTYISSVDRTQYTMLELERAALRDIGKFLLKTIRKLVPKDSGDARKSLATWNKKPFKNTAAHLSIGVYNKETAKKKNKTYTGFYWHIIEFGSRTLRALRPLQNGTFQNVDQIREITAQYLKEIEDERKALSLIDEKDEVVD